MASVSFRENISTLEKALPHVRPTILPLSWRKISVEIIVSISVGVLFYMYLCFSETGIVPLPVTHYAGFLISACTGLLAGRTLHFVTHKLDVWFPWRSGYSGRLAIGNIVHYLLVIILIALVTSITISLAGRDVYWKGFMPESRDLLIKAGIILLAAIFIYNVVYALLYSYQQYAIVQLESVRSERKQMELQFEALKSQVSPHYLFNSLNTISSLIYKDSESAEQFIRRLAQTYQYILTTQNRHTVSIKEEIDFVQSFYYLLKIRFQQFLTLEINLPTSVMQGRIPPLTLQILVENAVKHNPVSAQSALYIYITAIDNTMIKVVNTKTKEVSKVQSFGIGLDNIRRRYSFFTNKPVQIKNDKQFVVLLPVITDQGMNKGKR